MQQYKNVIRIILECEATLCSFSYK